MDQQPIQEKTQNKPPVKINWKLFAISIFVALSVGGGALIYFFSKQTQVPSPDQIPKTLLVAVYSHGRLCPTGECRSKVEIYSDGTFVYVPDLNIEAGQAARIKGSISIENLSSLKQAIQKSDFQKIKEKKFTGICPTAYDGTEMVYIFYVGNIVKSVGEEIASCTVAIDRSSSPFQILDEIINNEIISRTQGEDEEKNVLDTSTWQTYRNDEFGFEVRYPTDWEKEPGHQEPNEVNFVDQRLVGDIAVKNAQISINAKKVSLEFIRTWSPGRGKIRIIGGIPVMELEDPHSKKGAYESKFYSFIYGDNFYQIHTEVFDMATVPKSLRDPRKTHEFYRKVFDQILSTFRFVEPTFQTQWNWEVLGCGSNAPCSYKVCSFADSANCYSCVGKYDPVSRDEKTPNSTTDPATTTDFACEKDVLTQ